MTRSGAETCGISETCGAVPPMGQKESDSMVQFDESLQFMPSDDEEQQYWKMRSIYRVPARITNLDREASQPQVVSFGPYHHGQNYLLPMEEHKRRAVRHFLKRSGKPLEHFFKSLQEVACDLEESYDALDPKWKACSGEDAAHRFLVLMITDGCFMLEFLRFADPTVNDNMVNDYDPNDPIFNHHRRLPIVAYIARDMLMLENQLPMLVLNRLGAVERDGKKDDEFVNSLILRFCFPSMAITTMGKNRHALDLFRKCMLRQPKEKDEVPSNYSLETIHLTSATELSEHGIWFKRSKTERLDDISFEGGVLTLPMIWLDGSTKSKFLNLMAFEHFHVGAGNEVMSYIYCMDNLINNWQDVQVLCAQGIILNFLGKDEAVVKLFDLLAKAVTLDPSGSLVDVLKRVNKYRNKRWNMWRANLIQTYFRNPWVTLSLLAAVFLFALTIIQTIYSVLGYLK